MNGDDSNQRVSLVGLVGILGIKLMLAITSLRSAATNMHKRIGLVLILVFLASAGAKSPLNLTVGDKAFTNTSDIVPVDHGNGTNETLQVEGNTTNATNPGKPGTEEEIPIDLDSRQKQEQRDEIIVWNCLGIIGLGLSAIVLMHWHRVWKNQCTKQPNVASSYSTDEDDDLKEMV